MTELVLEFLCAREVNPVSFAQIAARNGVRRITVCIKPFRQLGSGAVPFGNLIDWDLIGDTPNRREFKRHLEAENVILESADVFFLTPGADIEADRLALESAGWLGAESVMAVPLDDDPVRLADTMRRFCAMAAESGLKVVHEFSPRMAIKNVRDSLAFQRSIGASNLLMSIDALHFFRGENDIADVAAIRPEELSRLQLCDGSINVPPEGGGYEAFYERMIPGEGSFDLKALISAVDPGVLIGLETPLWNLQQQGVQPADRVELIVRKSRALIDAVRGKQEAGV